MTTTGDDKPGKPDIAAVTEFMIAEHLDIYARTGNAISAWAAYRLVRYGVKE